ncbi:MAG: DNA replication/repair protein RecF [Myxococcales bacterium]|nr:DNA replication/repair protein RecF [Myxococcales bacterium]
MELQYLRIENFRNLRDVEFEPGRRFNVFHGRNGQGKTNLLEAVYMLSAVKGFRGGRNIDMIRWEQPGAAIEGHVERAGHQRYARLEISPEGRRVRLNGSPVRHLSDFFGTLNTVVFSPDDLMILKGGPSDRRQFLNRAVFSARSTYLADVQAYERVLRQRNAFLKEGRGHRTLLEVYNEQLSELGALIAQRRLEFLTGFEPLYSATFNAIFTGSEEQLAPGHALRSRVVYLAAWTEQSEFVVGPDNPPPDVSHLQAQFLSALQGSEGDDRRRGFTTVGPHRDDLRLELGQYDARTYASQGQMRAIVLAMKIAQIRLVQERHSHTPILLLDDVSSELDRSRNRFLFDYLNAHEGQVFITTTHRDYIQLDHEVTSFEIAQGNLSASHAS